jgi:hypothetical protein
MGEKGAWHLFGTFLLAFRFVISIIPLDFNLILDYSRAEVAAATRQWFMKL